MSKTFAGRLKSELKPSPKGSPLAVDLFAGCGGLALGFEAAGFSTMGFELEAAYCATYRKNLHGECLEIFISKKLNRGGAIDKDSDFCAVL